MWECQPGGQGRQYGDVSYGTGEKGGGEGRGLGVQCGVSGRHCRVSGVMRVSGEIEVLEQG